jgi:hypothetical protein
MLRRLFLLAAFVAVPFAAQAQSKVSADDLTGQWQVVINLDEKIDEAENAIERMAIKAMSGLLDEFDIRLLFETDGIARIEVVAFGEEANVDEDEDLSWEITRHGGLVLGESDQFDSEDTIFFRNGDQLIAYEMNEDGKPGARKPLSLQRVES